MHLRRPVAAVVTALAVFGGGATLTACADPAGGPSSTNRDNGTTDDVVNQGPGPGPNFTDPQRGVEQGGDQPSPG